MYVLLYKVTRTHQLKYNVTTSYYHWHCYITWLELVLPFASILLPLSYVILERVRPL